MLQIALKVQDHIELHGKDSAGQETVFQFSIVKLIGVGASCFVYVASRKDSVGQNHRVVLKEFFPEQERPLARQSDGSLKFLTNPIEALDRFRAGYKTHTGFQNNEDAVAETSNACEFYAGNGSFYIEIAFDGGTSYDQAPAEPLVVSLQVCRAIAIAVSKYHDLGLLHLDIKPENILKLVDSTNIKLFDFDSVIEMEKLQQGPCRVSFSTRWAAPELLQGKFHEVGKATDLYAIGAILFWRIMGRQVEYFDRQKDACWDIDKNSDLFATSSPAIYAGLTDLFHMTLNSSVRGRCQTTNKLICQLDLLIRMAVNRPVMEAWYAWGESSKIVERQKKELISRGKEIEKGLLPQVKLHDKEFSLYDAIKLRSKIKQPIFLVGTGGAGKTYLLWHTMDRIIREDGGRGWKVPVLVSLQECSKEGMSLTDFIQNEILRTVFNEKSDDHTRLVELLDNKAGSAPTFLLIIDGLNEIIDQNLQANLLNQIINLTGYNNVHLLVAGRNVPGELVKIFQRVEMLPLSSDNINKYLEQRNKNDVNDVKLLELLSNPMMLYVFTESIQKGNTDQVRRGFETKSDLLDEYIFQIEMKLGKKFSFSLSHKSVSEILRKYLGAIMFDLSVNGGFFIRSDRLKKILEGLMLQGEVDVCLTLICEGSGLLPMDPETGYASVTHQIFRDYLAAIYVTEQMADSCSKRELAPTLSRQPFPIDLMQFIGEILGEDKNVGIIDGKKQITSDYQTIINDVRKTYPTPDVRQLKKDLLTRQLSICNIKSNQGQPSTAIAVFNLLEMIWLSHNGITLDEHAELHLEQFHLAEKKIDEKAREKFPHYKQICKLLGKSAENIKRSRLYYFTMAIAYTIVILFLIFMYVSTTPPAIVIESPAAQVVANGSNLQYFLTLYANGSKQENFPISANYIELHGFDADIGFESVKDSYKVVLNLQNIQGDSGKDKYFTIKAGSYSSYLHLPSKNNPAVNSEKFKLVAEDEKITTTIRGGVRTINNGGSANGYFASWYVEFTSSKPFSSDLTTDDIGLYGFTATARIDLLHKDDFSHQYKITLSNLDGTPGPEKKFKIRQGVAINRNGMSSPEAITANFELINYKDSFHYSELDLFDVGLKLRGPVNQHFFSGGSLVYFVEGYSMSPSGYKKNLDISFLELNGLTADSVIYDAPYYGKTVLSLNNIRITNERDFSIRFKPGAFETFNGIFSDEKLYTGRENDDGSFMFIGTENWIDTYNYGIGEPQDIEPPQIKFLDEDDQYVPIKRNTVSFVVSVDDNFPLGNFKLTSESIELHGFTADIKVTTIVNGIPKTPAFYIKFEFGIELSNIVSTNNGDMYITIKKGAVIDSNGIESLRTDKSPLIIMTEDQPYSP